MSRNKSKKKNRDKGDQSFVRILRPKSEQTVTHWFDGDGRLLQNANERHRQDAACCEGIVQEFSRPPSLLDHIRLGLIDLKGENLNVPIGERPDLTSDYLFDEDIQMITLDGDVRPLSPEEVKKFGLADTPDILKEDDAP